MQSDEIRKRFLSFFEKKGHKIIPSASLVPENDPSVLFNTAGMQPLVPYLLGQLHPMGKRIVDIQKCVRTGDLDDIGDNRHFSFFEMMGNWSLGDYFKEEAIAWSYEFLTSKEEGLGLDPKRLYITIFEGDENAPIDTESKNIWMKAGIPENRIYALPAEDNWWGPGDNGPCGPCSEMFYDMSGNTGDLTHEEFLNAVNKEDVIEIWNDVFMEYEKKDGKVIGKLKQKNIDTGAGLERITAVMQGKNTAYDTDIFENTLEEIKKISKEYDEKNARVIADHIRAALFLSSEGVIPSSKERGYILRRLIRRAASKCFKLKFENNVEKDSSGLFTKLIKIFQKKYKHIYPEIDSEKNIEIIIVELLKFVKTLGNGMKEFEKAFLSLGEITIGEHHSVMPGNIAFNLYTTYGFPIELILELAKERDIDVDIEDFNKKMEEHQKLSQTASAGMFKGGLANHNEKTVRLHTAHHLLLAGLQAALEIGYVERGVRLVACEAARELAVAGRTVHDVSTPGGRSRRIDRGTPQGVSLLRMATPGHRCSGFSGCSL